MDNQKETEQAQTVIAMADCMDMVRQELVEAGVIGNDVPPMFVAEAALAYLGRMRAAFHANMIRAYPDRTHEEIADEIDKACGADRRDSRPVDAKAAPSGARVSEGCDCGCNDPVATTPRGMLEFLAGRFEFAGVSHAVGEVYARDIRKILASLDAEDTPSDGQIYEAVSRRADPAGHAAAMAEAQAVLGQAQAALIAAQPRDIKPAGWERHHAAIDAVEHAMLGKSVTVTEKGPWQVNDWGQGRIVIQSNDFTHDVALEISGDFGSLELERAHAEEIARRLNAWQALNDYPDMGSWQVAELVAASDALVARWHSREWREAPTAAFIGRLTAALGEVKFRHGQNMYTCIGKGGEYEKLGECIGAGTQRGVRIVVYRDVLTRQLYFRGLADFTERMERIKGPV